MLENYFPVLMFIAVGLVLGGVLLTVGRAVAPHKPDPKKLSPYECGFEAFEDARMKFDVRYYLVAILFILSAMMVFLAILVVGFVYEWKKGALEWE